MYFHYFIVVDWFACVQIWHGDTTISAKQGKDDYFAQLGFVIVSPVIFVF